MPAPLSALVQAHPHTLQARVVVNGDATPAEGALADVAGQARARYGARPGTLYAIRPDGYVLSRWRAPACEDVGATLAPLMQTPQSQPAGARHAS
ncbi:FAD-dependent oxidoreductase [compost metagenome]